ncbi:MAG: quinoprotein dehydrogenase-associated SoxYZ-like carrier [Sulfitobacter sp.]
MRRFAISLLAFLATGTALPALASGEAWESIQFQLYGERPTLSGERIIAIDAPYRTQNDARTHIAAQIIAPEGAELDKVTVVLDENPMPVSAVFDLDQQQRSFFFDLTMRINGPTPMHVIAETTDGRLFVSETFVKTSGSGACAAPPGTDIAEALATLGNMQIEVTGTMAPTQINQVDALLNRLNRVDVDISHPSHSGMQMDQISLLFIPLRYVESVDIELDGGGFVEMTGSISLSENPTIGLAVPQRTQSLDVTMTDTDGTVSHAHKDLAGF